MRPTCQANFLLLRAKRKRKRTFTSNGACHIDRGQFQSVNCTDPRVMWIMESTKYRVWPRQRSTVAKPLQQTVVTNESVIGPLLLPTKPETQSLILWEFSNVTCQHQVQSKQTSLSFWWRINNWFRKKIYHFKNQTIEKL